MRGREREVRGIGEREGGDGGRFERGELVRGKEEGGEIREWGRGSEGRRLVVVNVGENGNGGGVGAG